MSNDITTISGNRSASPILELKLSDNQLIQIISAIGRRTVLRSLDLSHPLYRLPSAIALWDHCTTFHIDRQLIPLLDFQALQKTRARLSPEMILTFVERDFTLLNKGQIDEQELLYHACAKGSSKVVAALLWRNVKVDEVSPGFTTFNPLDWAFAHGQFEIAKQITSHFGIRYTDVEETKFLAHVWGIGGHSEPRPIKIAYEGFNRLLASLRFSSLACAFIDEQARGCFSAYREAIKSALRAAPGNISKNPADLVDEIFAGKPVVLYTGCNTHINVIIFFMELVLKCDCGSGSAPSREGVEVFQRTKNSCSMISVIEDLQEKARTKEGLELFTTGINERLGLIPYDYLELDQQLVGNCGWASGEAGFLGLLYVIFWRCLSPRRAAIEVFDKWRNDVQLRALQWYLAKVANPDLKLLEIIRNKINQRMQKS